MVPIFVSSLLEAKIFFVASIKIKGDDILGGGPFFYYSVNLWGPVSQQMGVQAIQENKGGMIPQTQSIPSKQISQVLGPLVSTCYTNLPILVGTSSQISTEEVRNPLEGPKGKTLKLEDTTSSGEIVGFMGCVSLFEVQGDLALVPSYYDIIKNIPLQQFIGIPSEKLVSAGKEIDVGMNSHDILIQKGIRCGSLKQEFSPIKIRNPRKGKYREAGDNNLMYDLQKNVEESPSSNSRDIRDVKALT